MDFHAMEICFPIDEQTSHWRFKPGSYLASIIGHEGPGSLHSYLKERGWITTLSTGVQDIARGIATFKITFYLSQNGFREPTLGLYLPRSLLTSFPFQRKLSRSCNGWVQVHLNVAINRP
jgi:insulysin